MKDEDTGMGRQQGTHEETHADRIVIDSANLFAGRKEIRIRHDGELYRLLITRNGKLILNK